MMTKKDKTWIQQSIFLSIFELESQIHSSHSFANEKLVIYHFVKNLMLLFLHLLESELELNHGSFFGGSFIFFFFFSFAQYRPASSSLDGCKPWRPRRNAHHVEKISFGKSQWKVHTHIQHLQWPWSHNESSAYACRAEKYAVSAQCLLIVFQRLRF